jgi:hypothetical protein
MYEGEQNRKEGLEGNLKERDHLESLSVNETKILKCILKK